MLRMVLDLIIYTWGIISLSVVLVFAFIALKDYIKSILRKQRKIKCLCHHEYEPSSAFYNFNGVEYDFKCRKCGKVISIQTVTDDKFGWIDI